MISKNHNRRGFTLIETLLYVFLFAILALVVIDSLIFMTKAYSETNTYSELTQVSPVMDRLSREIRQATSVDAASTSTDLKLNTTGTNTTIEFLLSGTDIQLKENGTLTGNLNTPDIAITGLTFTKITTTKGSAEKISLSAKYLKDKKARVENFYDTIILRGDYAN